MANSRRESHHRNGITDPQGLQQTSATKSANRDQSASQQFSEAKIALGIGGVRR
jgi:hypothetical protein